jgi:hypothetical protein
VGLLSDSPGPERATYRKRDHLTGSFCGRSQRSIIAVLGTWLTLTYVHRASVAGECYASRQPRSASHEVERELASIGSSIPGAVTGSQPREDRWIPSVRETSPTGTIGNASKTPTR